MLHAHRVWLASAFVAVSTAACSAILGLDPPPGPDDAGAATDATTNREGAPEAAPLDGGGATDASTESSAPPVCASLDAGNAVYSPLAQVALDDAGTRTWDFFDPTAITGATAFSGGAFDGRYVYLAGRGNSVLRYDTTAGPGAFDGGAAWSAVRVSSLATPVPIPGGFAGAVFDGRYVYFVPYESGTTPLSVVARFDTQGVFDAGSSWSSFDVATLSVDGGAPTEGFTGGVFDGRYVYFVPRNDGVPDGRVVRYDTSLADAGSTDAGSTDAGSPDTGASDAGTADAGAADAGDAGDASTAAEGFTNPALWSTFDVSSTNPAATGFAGGVFDGKSVYLVPSVNDAFDAAVNKGTSGIVASYLVDASFQDAASWATFDMTRVNGDATNMLGGAFDGRFVYFAPRGSGVALRFDTKGSGFDSLQSWSPYDLTRVIVREGGASPAFGGVAYDGRYVYFVPTTTGFGTLARYDTLSPFGADCAWSTVDLTQLYPADGGAQDFVGAVFDGQYLYLIPDWSGPVARFNARTPPATPPFQGSFL